MLIQRRPAPPDAALTALMAPGGAAHPLLARIFASRNITDPADLILEPAGLLPPSTLKGLQPATELLWQTLQQQGRILVVSDFDADGATSCAVVLRALRLMGFNNLDFIVPDRFTYGYGLSPEIVPLAIARDPQLIITVDNGISSHEGVALAKEAGISVLITDHHLPGATLPAADAIVNPNQPGCTFASKALAGVGVVFYLMLGLRALLRDKDWFGSQGIAEPRLADLLDLVALGTVADVVPLDRNNRILVSEGLRRIRQGRACEGILALLNQGRRPYHTLVAADLGFAVGPRLNAAGRLEDMSLGIACLLSDDAQSARQLAARLDRINDERKRIEGEMREQAMAALNTMQAQLNDTREMPAALCLYDAQWHQGVVGILASRVKEQFHRPVIVFADADSSGDDCTEVKGSARSVPGLHIRDLLDQIAAQHPGLISRFGGHAMAAGLSLDKSRLDDFEAAFVSAARQLLDADALQKRMLTDGAIEAPQMRLETAEMLREAGPWGQGFPEPLFDGEFELVSQRIVGEKHLKMTLLPLHSRDLLDAIAFNIDTSIWPDQGITRVHLVYKLDVNEFRGQRQLQLLVEHLQPIV
ncbi:single-stranded-DNA-specific exonuclease RecJ [Pseudohongiella acticola]|uniref:Single-stranded-DNA-specific exonuclease RecJ n=1 Tax=Pseudohongiella acticola TaxID=1524254 RepID=A0A1E8CIK6_9GAMM|nr:single-stranded-DNA-specific exonuclease RecJ [Pseudohongiella acticola]